MGLAVKAGQGFKDFRKGMSVIFGRPRPGEGDRKLARIAILVEGQIDAYGKQAVRTQVIKSIESDMKRKAKKGKEAVDTLMQTAFDTPEYMRMLHKVGLEESHVRVMAMEALRRQNGKK
jgi:hypothetical protein